MSIAYIKGTGLGACKPSAHLDQILNPRMVIMIDNADNIRVEMIRVLRLELLDCFLELTGNAIERRVRTQTTKER
ncbi:hypothetical protein BMS3Bbin10_01560 [bacterium BMS3Bbin10]|nr:hypothetical protein BMS3Bbin10_01560 [bacterium BMS3Bbin10]